MTQPDPREQMRNMIAEAEGKRRNGAASDGRGWYRTQPDRDECYAVADAVMELAQRLRTVRALAEGPQGEGDFGAVSASDLLDALGDPHPAESRPPVELTPAEPAPDLTDRLAAALTDVNRTLWEKGHPGTPSLRTCWIPVSTVETWRALLAEHAGGKPDAHPWQEYNAHGNTCHYPGCRMTEDEHEETA